MKDLALRLIGTGALASLCAFAVANLSFPSGSAIEGPPVDLSSEVAADPTTPSALVSARSDVYYAAILDRPLFSDTRRPRVPDQVEEVVEVVAEPVEEPAPPPLPEVSLHGVMANGETTRVLISVDGAAPIWLSDGEKIGGWTISEAGADWLEVTAGNQKFRLDLFE